MAQPTTLMTEGPVWRRIVSFALPVFWGNLFQQLYNVVDSLVVGNFVGSEALAAVGSSGTLIFLLVGFFGGLFTGASVVISRYFGARDQQNVQKAVHTAMAFGLCSGVLLTVLGVAVTPSILRLIGTPEKVLPNSIVYFRIYFAGFVAMSLYSTCNGIFQAVGDSRHPLYYLIFSSITNVVLDLLFVAVFGWGVAGAAVATLISQFVSAVLALRRLTHVQEEYRVELKKVRMDGPMLREILHMGIPSGVQNSIIAFANIVVQSSINMYGDMAVAGCGAYSKIEGFGFLPITSCALALSTFVSQNLGAKKYDRAKKGAVFGVIVCLVLSELVGLAVYLGAPTLIAAFNGAAEVVRYGTLHARTITLFYFLLAFSHSAAGILRGAGKAVVPMLVMMLCWCAIRVTYLFVYARGTGDIQSIFWAYPLTWTLSSIIFVVYLIKADWLHAYDRMQVRI